MKQMSLSDYKFVVLYENFCTTCGEPGHVSDQCARFKTTLCKFWNGKGCLNMNCQYAHGRWELRKPHKFKCAKVFEIAPRTFVVRGCGERNTHHYNACPKQGLLWPPAATAATPLTPLPPPERVPLPPPGEVPLPPLHEPQNYNTK